MAGFYDEDPESMYQVPGDSMINALIEDDDYESNFDEDGKQAFKILSEHGEEFLNNVIKNVMEGGKHLFLPQIAKNIHGLYQKADDMAAEGFKHQAPSETVAPFVRGVKESLMGNPSEQFAIDPNAPNDINTLSSKEYAQWRKHFMNAGKKKR